MFSVLLDFMDCKDLSTRAFSVLLLTPKGSDSLKVICIHRGGREDDFQFLSIVVQGHMSKKPLTS